MISNEVVIYIYPNCRCMVENSTEGYSREFESYQDAMQYCINNHLWVIETYT